MLVYLATPFLTPPESPWFLGHQNRRRCLLLAKLLDEFGYVVDVADSNDVRRKKFRARHRYDLILSARVEADYLRYTLQPGARKIFLATTMEHRNHNRNLQRRHEMLASRRGISVPLRRQYSEQMTFAEMADAIVGVGNSESVLTWSQTSKAKLYSFNNHVHEVASLAATQDKDFTVASRNFLFMASGSQVQKGLDLLLEVFPRHPRLGLYVCSGFFREPEFCDCYHKELFETANIHPIGWIEVGGPGFHELAQKCAFVIAPSCSEGQVGSVAHCMAAGLIPLVTREAGIDTEDFGVTVADDSIDEIERVILELAAMSDGWLRERSRAARKAAQNSYSETEFFRRWREILGEVLADRASMGGGR